MSRACAALLAGLLVLAGGTVREAQAAAESPSIERTRHTPVLRTVVLVKLQQAQRAAEEGDYDHAQRVLDKLRQDHEGGRRLNAYELANLYNFYAVIHYASGHKEKALADYQQVLEQKPLPRAMEVATRYRLAELYIAAEQYRSAADMLQAWFKLAPNPAAEAYFLRAQAEFRLQQNTEALAHLRSGIAEAVKRRQPPQEAWYLLARALHFEMGDKAGTAQALETLVRNWPRQDYFLQLAAVYGELGNKQRQLAAMESIYLGGWLSEERDLLGLAYLYLDGGIPYRAARLLDRAMVEGQMEQSAPNLELLGIGWLRARETASAMPVLERAAALANDADGWARLASIELEEGRYDHATLAARKALYIGGGKRPDSTRVVLGVALFRLGKLDDSREVFAEARQDERSSIIAEQWIKYLEREIRRGVRDSA